MPEKTFLMLKPDAVSRGLQGKIFKALRESGLKIIKQKNLSVTIPQAEELYAVHKGKRFYDGLLKFITSGPVIACIAEGEGAVMKLRELLGDTDPRKAAPGTIRADLKEENVLTSYGVIKNLVHGSDSRESAEFEIPIFFRVLRGLR